MGLGTCDLLLVTWDLRLGIGLDNKSVYFSFSENYNNRVWKNQIISKKMERNLLVTEERKVKNTKEKGGDHESVKSNRVAPVE